MRGEQDPGTTPILAYHPHPVAPSPVKGEGTIERPCGAFTRQGGRDKREALLRPARFIDSPTGQIYNSRYSLEELLPLVVLLLLACVFISLAACGPSTSQAGQGSGPGEEERELRVFAAASLTEAFQEMATAYSQSNPGVEVDLAFDGSQRLRLQLEHGAEADVFASADWVQTRAAMNAGVLSGKPLSFASNELVFLLYDEAGGGLAATGSGDSDRPTADVNRKLKVLAGPDVKIVAALQEAPVGRYTEELLDKMAADPEFGPSYSAGIRNNIVSRETNVRGVAQKVALGEADAGVAYRTDALALQDSAAVSVLEAPGHLAVVANYPIAAVSDRAGAGDFINFVLSEEGQAILKAHGFGPPVP